MPTFHGKVNGCYGQISVAPSPVTTGQVFTFSPIGSAVFPAVPFVLTVWPADVGGLNSNMELILVTAVTGFQVTACTRGYEGSTPRTILVGDQAGNTITAGDIDMMQDAINQGLNNFVTMPTATADAGEAGDWSIDDNQLAIYSPGVGFMFFQGFQK